MQAVHATVPPPLHTRLEEVHERHREVDGEAPRDAAQHHARLRRQQAEAVVAARKTLVEGAVGMVEMALEMLSAKNVVELDDERRAAMVSNLMVVLCGERDTQPVVNTGTLYS